MNKDSSAGIVTRLYDRHPRNHDSIPDRNKKFVSFSKWSRPAVKSVLPSIQLLSEDVSIREVKLELRTSNPP